MNKEVIKKLKKEWVAFETEYNKYETDRVKHTFQTLPQIMAFREKSNKFVIRRDKLLDKIKKAGGVFTDVAGMYKLLGIETCSECKKILLKGDRDGGMCYDCNWKEHGDFSRGYGIE